jgi:hypothetical protein
VIGRRWDHPCNKEIGLSIKGVIPTLRIVVDPDADGTALAATPHCAPEGVRGVVLIRLFLLGQSLQFEYQP